MKRLIAAVTLVAGVWAGVVSFSGEEVLRIEAESADTVVMIPGYGGGTGWTSALNGALREEGYRVVIADVGALTGDLDAVAASIVTQIERLGVQSVSIVGYSAGGVVARAVAGRIPERVHRVATIGAPHDGSPAAGFGVLIANDQICPTACQQLAPGSEFLGSLRAVDDPTRWLNLWSESDEVVPARSSATFTGAAAFPVGARCGSNGVAHGALAGDPVTVNAVLAFLRSGSPGC